MLENPTVIAPYVHLPHSLVSIITIRIYIGITKQVCLKVGIRYKQPDQNKLDRIKRIRIVELFS